MTIKIKKAWDNIEQQTVSDDNGNTWSIAEVIESSKKLDVMKIPMEHLCMNKRIAGISIRNFVGHMKMILDSDLEFPIILDEDGAVFDGQHRIARALLEEKDFIKAVRFDEDPPPRIVNSKK